ncbi:transketolase family protein [Faecalicatena contorta]|uniref:transketolase family protein n=1 Tax=Clostridia TaxID=186801 RepID=UPI00051C8CE9|nr:MULTISPECIES: transketolase family protein [Clostridia]MBM6685820.1 transketolase family protein [Faecalicatena contorta]MBM6711376.1 transketolase family protein [Faecalicatena contorta]HIY00187.1 transketolase family protein [Candidatus Dorea intestinigallinarum]
MGENISTRVAYGRSLEEFGGRQDIYVFDADLKSCTMTQYFADRYPERFFNIGIAEANMVDIAAGFATCGATALVHTFAMFAAGRVYDQVRNSVAYPGLNVKIIGSHAGLTVGEDGATHQCIEDISLMRTIPGMTVIVPCDANETRMATRAILDMKGPCYLRTGRCALECVTDTFENYHFEVGKGIQLVDGADVSIIACGLMVQEALKAERILRKEGISARIIDMHTIKPIDKEIIQKAAKETGAIVTAEEHNIIGGLGSAVSEVVVSDENVPVEMVGVKDVFGHSASPQILLQKYGLTPEDIASAARRVVRRKK